MAIRSIVVLVIVVLFHALSPNSGLSQDTFGPACGRATIDGRVELAEWSAASSRTFTMTGSQGTFEATLHVMNSKNYLYLGLTIDDDEFTTSALYLERGDGFRIDFDNDNSGSLFAIGDDNLSVSAGNPQYEDRHIYDATAARQDTLSGGTSDGVGFSSRQGSLNHFELRHPLCSGDSLDFCLSPGITIGFRLEYLDAKADHTFGGTFFYPGSSDTSLAHIVIAPCTLDDFFLYLPIVGK